MVMQSVGVWSPLAVVPLESHRLPTHEALLNMKAACPSILLLLAPVGLLLCVRFHGRRRTVSVRRALLNLAPLLGLLALIVAVQVHGGPSSPLAAALCLPICFAVPSLGPRGVLAVSLCAAGALLAIDSLSGDPPRIDWMPELSFLVCVGTLACLQAWERLDSRRRVEALSSEFQEQTRRLRKELEEARRLAAAGSNVPEVLHRLKNGVHALRGFADVLESRLDGLELAREPLSGLRLAIDQLARHAEEGLDAPLQGANSAPVGEVLSPRRIRKVIDSVVAEVSLSYPRIRWITICAQDLPPVKIPALVLRDTITNLARNAVESMGNDGAVAIRARKGRRNEVQISVQDEGGGIAEDALLNLYRPGFTTKADGSGFGLYLSRRLLQRHGGRLVRLPPEGDGEVFQITLNPALNRSAKR